MTNEKQDLQNALDYLNNLQETSWKIEKIGKKFKIINATSESLSYKNANYFISGAIKLAKIS